MGFFDAWLLRNKERRKETKERELTSLAERKIVVKDFEDRLYIAFDDIPVVPIEDIQSPKEIVEQLKLFREQYVKGKMAESRLRSVVF